MCTRLLCGLWHALLVGSSFRAACLDSQEGRANGRDSVEEIVVVAGVVVFLAGFCRHTRELPHTT